MSTAASPAQRSFRMLGAVTLALGTAVCGTAAGADDYYKGKTVNLYVGNGAGSGFDAYGRLLARHMGRHIPGNPSFVVQNMPGAGGARVNEFIARVGPKDGTAIAITMPGSLLQPLTMDASKFRYDPKQLAFIGNADSGTRICVVRTKTGIKSFEDVLKRKVTMGSTAPGGAMFDYAKLKAVLLGAQFNIVTGYKGANDVLLGVDREELDGLCGLDISTLKATRPTWLGSPDFKFLVQVAPNNGRTNAELDKLGVPSLWKFVPKDKLPVFELVTSQQYFQRPFIAHPETAPAALKILRAAFLASLKDKETLAEADKMRLAIDPTSGEAASENLKKMYAAPKALIEQMAAATKP